MKYEVHKQDNGTAVLNVFFGPDKDDDCMGVSVSDPAAVKIAVDVLTENLMKKCFGFTPLDLRMSLLNIFVE
jgi:hypothetical protein